MVALIPQQRLSLSIAPAMSPGERCLERQSPPEYRVAMHEVFRVYRTAHSPSRTGINHSLAVFGSLDFQTCRISDSSKSAVREAALEVGLETWAATIRRRDLTHSLSLSLVASCHR